MPENNQLFENHQMLSQILKQSGYSDGLGSTTFLEETSNLEFYKVANFICRKIDKQLFERSFVGCRQTVNMERKDQAAWRKAMKAFWESAHLNEKNVPEPSFHLMTRPYGVKFMNFLLPLACCLVESDDSSDLLSEKENQILHELMLEKNNQLEEHLRQVVNRNKSLTNQLSEVNKKLVSLSNSSNTESAMEEHEKVLAKLTETTKALPVVEQATLSMLDEQQCLQLEKNLKELGIKTEKQRKEMDEFPLAVLESQTNSLKAKKEKLEDQYEKDLARSNELEKKHKTIIETYGRPFEDIITESLAPIADLLVSRKEWCSKQNFSSVEKKSSKSKREKRCTVFETTQRLMEHTDHSSIQRTVNRTNDRSRSKINFTLDESFNPKSNSTAITSFQAMAKPSNYEELFKFNF